MSDMNNDPVDLEEPSGGEFDKGGNVWARGLFMLIFLFFFGVGEAVLAFLTIVQFLWMLFGKEKNEVIADFGAKVGRWMHDVAAFQTGSTDEKPFPWKKLG